MNVKGTTLVSTKKYIIDHYGKAAWQELIDELPEEFEHHFMFDLCKALWYPFDLYVQLTELIEKKYGSPDQPSIAYQLGAYTAENERKIVLKLFYKLGTPEIVLKLATWAFHRYFDFGKAKLPESRKGRVVIEISELPVYNQYHIARTYGWCVRAIELTGAKNLKHKKEIIEKDDDTIIRLEFNWE